MATVTNAVVPQIDFTCLHTVKSQQPTHILCLAFLTHLPPPPSPSQLDIDMDDTNNHDFIDSDTFGGGTSSVFPNSSGPATPVASKCVRTASDDDHTHSEASSGTKHAKLDNVTSNSSDGSTTSPSHSKEKKFHSLLWGMLIVVNLKMLTMKMLCRLFFFMQCMSMRAALLVLVPIQIQLIRANGPRFAGKMHVTLQWRIMVQWLT